MDFNPMYVHFHGVLCNRPSHSTLDYMQGDISLASEGSGSSYVSILRMGIQLHCHLFVPSDWRWRVRQSGCVRWHGPHLCFLMAFCSSIRPRNQRLKQRWMCLTGATGQVHSGNILRKRDWRGRWEWRIEWWLRSRVWGYLITKERSEETSTTR